MASLSEIMLSAEQLIKYKINLGGGKKKKKLQQQKMTWSMTDQYVSSTDDGEQAGCEAWDKVFARTSTDNRVVSAGDCRPMISSHHQAHFNELAGVAW